VSAVVADTHAVVWYFFGSSRLSATARAAIESAVLADDPVFVATVSLVEVAYLIEKGRLLPATLDRLVQELSDPDARFVPYPLDTLVAASLPKIPRTLIPDMPDRIIAATARHLNCPLVTAEQRIRSSNAVATIW
jgi:PIN domain nuclease of toxin-antitoxin system